VATAADMVQSTQQCADTNSSVDTLEQLVKKVSDLSTPLSRAFCPTIWRPAASNSFPEIEDFSVFFIASRKFTL